MAFKLNWTVFDGRARRNRLAQAEANVHEAEAQICVSRDQIANEVWAAYSDLNTALRQREAATALLEAAGRSYDAALESYNYGLRNLLDVTAAQRTLAQARSTDVSPHAGPYDFGRFGFQSGGLNSIERNETQTMTPFQILAS